MGQEAEVGYARNHNSKLHMHLSGRGRGIGGEGDCLIADMGVAGLCSADKEDHSGSVAEQLRTGPGAVLSCLYRC